MPHGSKPSASGTRIMCARLKYIASFPIQCNICNHSQNITDGLDSTSTIIDKCDYSSEIKPVALDCEMVGVGPKFLSALGRVSIVDYSGKVLYDVMVRPDEEITDYRTRWSGIRDCDMRRAIPFSCVQEQVLRIIQKRIVVGHMLENDFNVLHFQHPRSLVRDTGKAPYAKVVAGFPTKPCISLRALTLRLFGVSIQNKSHCSIEDTRATMAIYRLFEHVWEADLLKNRAPSIDKSIFSTLLEHSNTKSNKASTSSSKLKRSFSEIILSKQEMKISTDEHQNVDHFSQFFSLKKSRQVSLLNDNFWPESTNV